jgi:hypothetical protein
MPSRPLRLCVSIYLSARQVRVLIGERCLEVWAIGAKAAYRLHIPRLYGKVRTLCTVVRLDAQLHVCNRWESIMLCAQAELAISYGCSAVGNLQGACCLTIIGWPRPD